MHTVADVAMDALLAEHDIVECTGPPGTVVFAAPLMVHGSAPNNTNSNRRNMYFVYNRLDKQPLSRETKREEIANTFNLNDMWVVLDEVEDDALTKLAADSA